MHNNTFQLLELMNKDWFLFKKSGSSVINKQNYNCEMRSTTYDNSGFV